MLCLQFSPILFSNPEEEKIGHSSIYLIDVSAFLTRIREVGRGTLKLPSKGGRVTLPFLFPPPLFHTTITLRQLSITPSIQSAKSSTEHFSSENIQENSAKTKDRENRTHILSLTQYSRHSLSQKKTML